MKDLLIELMTKEYRGEPCDDMGNLIEQVSDERMMTPGEVYLAMEYLSSDFRRSEAYARINIELFLVSGADKYYDKARNLVLRAEDDLRTAVKVDIGERVLDRMYDEWKRLDETWKIVEDNPIGRCISVHRQFCTSSIAYGHSENARYFVNRLRELKDRL